MEIEHACPHTHTNSLLFLLLDFWLKDWLYEVIAVITKGFNDSLQSLQPACAAPIHVNCMGKLMKDHKIWTFADDLVKIRW